METHRNDQRERDERAELEYLAASISSDEDNDEDYVYDYDPNGGGSSSSSDISDSSDSESDADNDGNNNVNRVLVELVDLTGTGDVVEGIAEGGEEPIHTAIDMRDIFLR